MIYVKNKRCLNESCDTIVHTAKYEGYCRPCFGDMFPDRPVVRKHKIKELAVTNFLKRAFPSVPWTCNRVIGVSRRMPDMLCDLGEQVLIVEVDENQHATYSKTDENKRMMELSGDVGHRPVVFIRFNPDDYVDADGVKHTSCFAINKQGVMTVKKCKLIEWEQRLSTLRGTVEHWMRQRTPNPVEVVSLFFTAE